MARWSKKRGSANANQRMILHGYLMRANRAGRCARLCSTGVPVEHRGVPRLHGRDARATIFGHARPAFTLVEMLVVIGIIVILISILVPMALYANKSAVRTRMQADLHTIGNALEAYKEDFKDYPRLGYMTASSPQSPTASSGAVLLCWALVAPGPLKEDGVNGPGFTIRTGAPARQSYLALSSFRIGLSVDTAPKPPPATPLPLSDLTATINDRYDHPILYFAAAPGTSPETAYVRDYATPAPGASNAAPVPALNFADNKNLKGALGPLLPLRDMQSILGAYDPATGIAGGVIDLAKGEKAIYTGQPYVLWGAGPDEVFGIKKVG